MKWDENVLKNDLLEGLMTQKDALAFVRQILKVNLNLEETKQLGIRKLDILNQIIEAFQAEEPFNNIELISKKKDHLRRPSWSEIKQAMFAQRGGLCYSMNAFFCTLTNFLGFKSYNSLAVVPLIHDNKYPNHAVCYFQDVQEVGDLYLVDVGVGQPMFEAVPLDFETKSQIYNQSFQRYYYKTNKEGGVSKIVVSEAGPFWPKLPDGSSLIYRAEVWPRSEREIKFRMDRVYNSPDLSPFLTNIKMIRFKNRKSVAINNYSLLVENEEGTMDKTTIEKDLLADTILDNFPTFEKNMVEEAVKNYQGGVFEGMD